jgi:hypothetical protein
MQRISGIAAIQHLYLYSPTGPVQCITPSIFGCCTCQYIIAIEYRGLNERTNERTNDNNNIKLQSSARLCWWIAIGARMPWSSLHIFGLFNIQMTLLTHNDSSSGVRGVVRCGQSAAATEATNDRGALCAYLLSVDIAQADRLSPGRHTATDGLDCSVCRTRVGRTGLTSKSQHGEQQRQ